MQRLLIFLLLFFSLLPVSPALAADPGTAGFTPLKYYPCPTTTGSEFHPLRPYPSSPCDPFIPKKIPEAPFVTSREYLTFSCDNSLNTHGTYTVLDFVPDPLPAFPGDCNANLEDSGGTTHAFDNYYDCGSSVCLVHPVNYELNIDLSPSRLPIIGNTEFPTAEYVLVNSYLDWYLNGTIFQSEHRAINPDNSYDQRLITTYTGPLLRQLPKETQDDIRNTISAQPPVNTDVHNYEVFGNTRMNSAGTNLYKYIPLATLEDTTSEVTVGLYPANQPNSDGYIIRTCTDRPFELVLGSDPSDSRLYFSHVRGDDSLSDLLASLSRPYPTGTTRSDDRDQIARVIDEHQGFDDSTRIQTYDYLTQRNTRNTEIGPNSVAIPGRYQAPPPLITPIPADPTCEEPVALSNYGDTLMGKDYSSTLVYTQHFEYTPQYRGSIVGCSLEGGNCYDDTDCCAYKAGYDPGGCSGGNPYGYCSGPDPCPSATDSSTCNALYALYGCNWHPPRPGHCGQWPRRELDSNARVSVFTKSPLVDRLYDTLVVGNQSVLRRFAPRKPEIWPYPEYIKGETDLDNTVPGETTAIYTGDTNDLDRVQVNGGNGNLPVDIYFERLGSLSDHFLGDITEEKVNLQKMLRPYVSPTPGPAPLPGSGEVLQHLFEPTCGSVCYEYIIDRTQNETSCNGQVLNPYFAIAIALNENGGLLSCEPGGTRFNHYGCDLYGLAGFDTTIDSKTTCMLNTLRNNCLSGMTDMQNLQNYGYSGGASSLSPLNVLGYSGSSLFISPSQANTYANSLRSNLPSQRDLWWHYYCGYINTYAQNSCGVTLDACNTPAP